MPKPIEFFFDFISPTTYLAWTQLPGLAQRTGAEIMYRPFHLGAVMKAAGNASPITVPVKRAYLFRDIERYAVHYGVPYRANSFFPMNTVPLMRAVMSYQMNVTGSGDAKAFIDLIFRVTWERGLNVADDAVLGEILTEEGFVPGDYAKRVQRPDVKQALAANTDEAVRRGAFGAPTFFIGDEMFFGQDRLMMVEKYAL